MVAEPALADLETLIRDNLGRLVPGRTMAPDRCVRHEDWLCLVCDEGESLRVIVADGDDGGKALLGALAVTDEPTEVRDTTMVLLSSRPPPGLRWLQRHGPVTWVRTLVLSIDGTPGLLLELPEEDAASAEVATAPCAELPIPDDLTPEEVAFFQHL